VINVILHGYDDAAEHAIVVSLSLEAGAVVVEMEDDAARSIPGKRPASICHSIRNSARSGGLGFISSAA
jgi:anti-sigma regulatory factor (Ser/Thr protein kinase)